MLHLKLSWMGAFKLKASFTILRTLYELLLFQIQVITYHIYFISCLLNEPWIQITQNKLIQKPISENQEQKIQQDIQSKIKQNNYFQTLPKFYLLSFSLYQTTILLG
ncbi:unnamed protein product [Paramecium pentaurelia]|uniref:Uncharacterized protein n=1 Tax=Paramecium pentaurelia TaxID=43138 RepID=A0A8S1WF86_9CILI|nr:unnamed protein product [Paramecium pentaurelia]